MVYCLTHYPDGHEKIAEHYAASLICLPRDPFLLRALDILRSRFVSDDRAECYKKDGPVSYARFLADPGRTALNAVHQRNPAGVVEILLNTFDSKSIFDGLGRLIFRLKVPNTL